MHSNITKIILTKKEDLKAAILAANEDYSNFNDKYDYSSIRDMSRLLKGCNKLKTIPILDTCKVTTMSYMFNGATSFNQPLNFDTSNVTNM